MGTEAASMTATFVVKPEGPWEPGDTVRFHGVLHNPATAAPMFGGAGNLVVEVDLRAGERVGVSLLIR